MKLVERFDEFVKEIRLTKDLEVAFQEQHNRLRDLLHDDRKLEKVLVDSFLQGSYRRFTAIRPVGLKKPDIDIIAVTKYDKNEFLPQAALDSFIPFVRKHYGDPVLQGHSLRVSPDGVEIDLVVTAAPSEAEQNLLRDVFAGADSLENPAFFKRYQATINKASSKTGGAWKFSPLDIPDRKYQVWEKTHPLAQIEWTQNKNATCSGHYVNIVKALKWWRASQRPDPERPKGYPLEHLIGKFCPSGISSLADGITMTLERIVTGCQPAYLAGQSPNLPDHGVSQNVMKNLKPNDFGRFYEHVQQAAPLARAALNAEDEDESARLWHELLGDPFPYRAGSGTPGALPRGSRGFVPPREPARPREQRFA